MNLIAKGHYVMYQFSSDHINALIFSVVFSALVIIGCLLTPAKKRGQYLTIMGFLFLGIKAFDMIYRVYVEQFPVKETLPLHFCNVLIILNGIYLITKKNSLFNISYYWVISSLIVLLIPSSFEYSTHLYIYSYILSHCIPGATVILGFIHGKNKITKKGFKIAIATYIFFFLFNMLVVNRVLGTNFFFANDYILPSLSFIKPFFVYVIALMLVTMSSMGLMYVLKRGKK